MRIHGQIEKREGALGKGILLLLVAAAIFSPIAIYIMDWLIEIESEYEDELFGIPGLVSAVFSCITVIEFFLIAMIATTLLMTWFNLKKANLENVIYPVTKRTKYLLDPSKQDTTVFYRADDEKLVIKRKRPFSVFLVSALLFVLALLIFLYDIHITDVSTYDGGCLFYMLMAILHCVRCYLIQPVEVIEFDRLKGTVTVPGFLVPIQWTYPFRRIQVNAYDNKLQIAIPYRLPNLDLVGEGNSEWWSFYVWYMDRNRPLPPGTLFDAYREKDLERRRSENFPAPLYKSDHTVTMELKS